MGREGTDESSTAALTSYTTAAGIWNCDILSWDPVDELLSIGRWEISSYEKGIRHEADHDHMRDVFNGSIGAGVVAQWRNRDGRTVALAPAASCFFLCTHIRG